MTKRVIPSRTLKNEPWASVWLNGVRSPEAKKAERCESVGRRKAHDTANEKGVGERGRDIPLKCASTVAGLLSVFAGVMSRWYPPIRHTHTHAAQKKKLSLELWGLTRSSHQTDAHEARRPFFCGGWIAATWLILPVIICCSQRLSHACLSASQTKVKPRKAHYISYGSIDCTQLLG